MRIAIALIVLVIVLGVLLYNSLINARIRVDTAWSQIDVQLQRRLDLIQNLVEAVRGYASHERSTLEAVVAARAQALQSSTPQDVATSQTQLIGAFGKLLLISESYPDLRANANFLSLQHELSATESKIAFSRSYYNESVQIFNGKITTFPANLLSRLTKLSARPYFELESSSREVPKVQF